MVTTKNILSVDLSLGPQKAWSRSFPANRTYWDMWNPDNRNYRFSNIESTATYKHQIQEMAECYCRERDGWR